MDHSRYDDCPAHFNRRDREGALSFWADDGRLDAQGRLAKAWCAVFELPAASETTP